MSLLSIDIKKVKKLSLKEVKLPAPEVRGNFTDSIQVERPPTEEEIAYSNLVRTNPLLEELVSRLALVSSSTGERIKKVEVKEDINKLEAKVQELDKPKLIALAQRVIEGGNSYTKEEIVNKIKKATLVSTERAERGFNLILEARGIEQTINPELYYLTGSTPF